MSPYLTGLKSTYEKHASPQLAIRMSAYMKNKFPYYGIQKPLCAEISKPFMDNLKNLSLKELDANVRWLWKQPQREFQYFAMEWSKSENLWLNRAAILFHLKYKSETDEMLLYRLINMHKGSDEFFIRKAIGTALRRYAITNKKSVLNFVNNANLKPLSKREALKRL